MVAVGEGVKVGWVVAVGIGVEVGRVVAVGTGVSVASRPDKVWQPDTNMLDKRQMEIIRFMGIILISANLIMLNLF